MMRRLPRPNTIHGTLARVIAAAEALEAGDIGETSALLSDLEHDLSRTCGTPRRLTCSCGESFRWAGELDRHRIVRGHALDEATR